jgi:hypothetical protein
MSKMGFALALVASLLVGVVTASAAPVNSNPAPSDNVRIYTMGNAPGLATSFDGTATSPLEAPGVMFTQLEPGKHRWIVGVADRPAASTEVSLSPEAMIESKGRRWWCLIAAVQSGRLGLGQMTGPQCKQIADAGPD